jgi:hypothetical protein
MGNCSRKRVNYIDHDYEDEIELRKFEEELGIMKNTFSDVLPRICVENEIISSTRVFESNLLNEFSESLLQLIKKSDYFYKEVNKQKFFDARKIKLLIFLLSRNKIISNSQLTYYDKASFILTSVKTNEEQKLCDAIEEREINFVKFIDDIVEISCEVLVNLFREIKGSNHEKEIFKFASIKPQITRMLIQNLFYQKNDAKSGGLTFNELNKKFENDKFIFTPGYIRDFAWKILSTGKSNEMDQEAQSELMDTTQKLKNEKEIKLKS